MTNNQASAERDVAERLILALEPFNLLATGVNMNDPLSKWFTMAQFQAARDAIEAALSAPARDGEGRDPDLGKIERGHVCKHGVRWPWSCDECDEAAWTAHQAATDGEGLTYADGLRRAAEIAAEKYRGHGRQLRTVRAANYDHAGRNIATAILAALPKET